MAASNIRRVNILFVCFLFEASLAILKTEENLPVLFNEVGEKVQFLRSIRGSNDEIEARRRSLDKNFMRFGRRDQNMENPAGERELVKRNTRVGKDGKPNLMRFGRANNNFLRFGRSNSNALIDYPPPEVFNDPDNMQMLSNWKPTGKRENLMRFGRNNLMRFGRADPKNLMRFGRANFLFNSYVPPEEDNNSYSEESSSFETTSNTI